jgi:hypothetical protein
MKSTQSQTAFGGIWPRGCLLVLCGVLQFAPAFVALAHAGEKTDGLLNLVPSDAGFTVALDDLRGFSNKLMASGLVDRLKQSPPIDGWLASEDGERFRKSLADLAKLFNSELGRLRDEVLGDAVVLSLHPGRPEAPQDAGGLLLVKARDHALLEQLIAALNGLEKGNGTLQEIQERRRGSTTYVARVFLAQGRPADFYRIFEDGTLVWTNSERLITAVIDRRMSKSSPGLADRADFQRMRAVLPPSLLSAFVDPAFVSRMAQSDPSAPRLDELPARLRSYVASLDYLAFALEWGDGPILHSFEDYKPVDAKLGWNARLSREAGAQEKLLSSVPRNAVAIMSSPLDFVWIYELLLDLSSKTDPAQRERLDTLFRGIALDRDPRTELLSKLGPATVAFLESPTEPNGAGVLAIALPGDSGVSRALDNSLRTALTFYSLDAAKRGEDWRIETVEKDGQRTTRLVKADNQAARGFAYSITPDQLVLSMQRDAIARYLTAKGNSGATNQFDRVRVENFPRAHAFGFVDLIAAADTIRARRPQLIVSIAASRPAGSDEQIGNDLDRLEELLRLGRVAYFASESEGDRMIHRRFGVTLDAD